MKAMNYTESQVETLKAMYKGEDNAAEVAEISKVTGKTPASVRAKLTSLGIYVPKEKAAKKAHVTKRAVVDEIAAIAGLEDFEADGLEKATAQSLNKVLAALKA